LTHRTPHIAHAAPNSPASFVNGLAWTFIVLSALSVLLAAVLYALFAHLLPLEPLRATLADAIVRAADEVLAGEHREQFVVDPYQAGAGTSHNMNVNEVLANRANELLGGRRGEYAPVHPNDHVNMAQSTNDTIPTNIRLACLSQLAAFVAAFEGLRDALAAKGQEFDDVVKAGRTHLQDAMPIRLGQEFTAYAGSLDRGTRRVVQAADYLRDLGIGGSAVGTGVTVDETDCSSESSAGSGTCTPSAPDDRLCDGIDEDCDGLIDEDYASISSSCGNGVCSAGCRTRPWGIWQLVAMSSDTSPMRKGG